MSKMCLVIMLLVSFQIVASVQPAYSETKHLYSKRVHAPDGDREGDVSWLINCYQDSFSDQRFCRIYAQRRSKADHLSNFRLTVFPNGRVTARVGTPGEGYLRSQQLVRVDKNLVHKIPSGDDFQLSGKHKELLNSLIRGKEIQTRWYKIPYTAIDERFSLLGFTAALGDAKAFLSGSVQYSHDEAVVEFKRQGALVAMSASRLRACGKESRANSLILDIQNRLKKLSGSNEAFRDAFFDSYQKTTQIDPYGPLKGKIACADTESEIRDSVGKIERAYRAATKTAK